MQFLLFSTCKNFQNTRVAMNKLDKLFCHSATFNSKISSESILKIKNTPTDKCKVMIIDIGTTNTKVKLYDHQHRVISSQNHRTQIHSPEENSSEIEPLNLWNNVASLCRNSLEELSLSASDITCMGLTTQRESFLIWNKYYYFRIFFLYLRENHYIIL
uniref:Glycerol kinase (Trinotate prediction) n=1 Tax=Henneguya salminicola TaxID=69463 RepID=A0A6G3MLB2_HENSL